MTEEKEIGNVLWFDQKKGFGFLKIITPDSEYLNKEVFVHFSSINCESSFKKLFPGENVSLRVHKNTEEVKGREYVCKDVTGLFNTPLLVDNEDHIYRVLKKRKEQDVTEE
tara:strand:- start:68 stop:400 length:333 start_codon:yes stop_codon:yes gene_type:complete